MSVSPIAVTSQMEGYLNDSGSITVLKNLITELCIEKPEKPLLFMIEYLNRLLAAERKAKADAKAQEEDDAVFTIMEDDAPRVPCHRERRGAVSAEPLTEVVLPAARTIKNDEQQARLENALASCLLFQHLEPSERKEITRFMVPQTFKEGAVIIAQGDEEGENFYVVDEGVCDVYVAKDGVQNHVQRVEKGGTFGELALIYNTPRAATVKASTDVQVLVIGRSLYRRVLMSSTMRKREMYESFLDKVPILDTLQRYEKLTIADSLEPARFKDGEVIVRQGDLGDVFYIILEGGARVLQRNEDGEDTEVGRLKPSEYFGEIALLTNRPRAATVVAVGDIECVKLDRDRFIRVLGPCEEILRRNMEAYNRYIVNRI